MGNYCLMYGSSSARSDVLKLVESTKFYLLLTDLPYNVVSKEIRKVQEDISFFLF